MIAAGAPRACPGAVSSARALCESGAHARSRGLSLKFKNADDGDGSAKRLNWRFILAVGVNVVVWSALLAAAWRCSKG